MVSASTRAARPTRRLMRIAFESMPASFPPDESPFNGLPDDRCQCPHWGYLIKGSFRVTYRDGPRGGRPRRRGIPPRPGHFVQTLEPAELIELSPRRGARPDDGDDRPQRGPGGIMTRTMTGYSARSIDELPTLWDGFAKLVRAGLDITAFGANIMDLPPDYSTTSHDESDSGQQELYVALRGSGSVDVEGTSLPLDADHLVRVDAGTARCCPPGQMACACSASAAYPAGCTSRRTGARPETRRRARRRPAG